MSEKSQKKRKKTMTENLAEFSGYPLEGLEKMPLLDCKWNREIQFYGCVGILEYDDTAIVLKTARGNCGIYGDGLYLENFHSDNLTVHGTIESIRFGEKVEKDV